MRNLAQLSIQHIKTRTKDPAALVGDHGDHGHDEDHGSHDLMLGCQKKLLMIPARRGRRRQLCRHQQLTVITMQGMGTVLVILFMMAPSGPDGVSSCDHVQHSPPLCVTCERRETPGPWREKLPA